jgi:hypothetical protein
MQKLALGQDTPPKEPLVLPVGRAGVFAIDQVEPFQV